MFAQITEATLHALPHPGPPARTDSTTSTPANPPRRAFGRLSPACYRRHDDAIRKVCPDLGPSYKSKIVLPSIITSDRFRLFSVVVMAPKRHPDEAPAHLGVLTGDGLALSPDVVLGRVRNLPLVAGQRGDARAVLTHRTISHLREASPA